jgi:histidinol phosphatase-like PHP family hydrolase
MIKHDIHIHTHLSDCAAKNAFIADYITEAKDIGLEFIGFADHAWDETVAGASGWYAPQTFKRLAARREELKSIDKGGISVSLGAEGEFANFILGLGADGAQYVDYVIIPHSHTHMKNFVIPASELETPKKHALFLLKSFISLCEHESRDLFFGIAHPMVPVGVNNEYIEEVFRHISESDLNECAHAAKDNRRVLELNLSAVNTIPPERAEACGLRRFFEACARAGCEFFMGSDAHRVDNLKKYHAPSKRSVALMGLNESHFIAAKHRIPSV